MIKNQYFSVKSAGVTPSGIAYQRPQLTGQMTSYRTGDDGHHLSAGTYDYVPPSNPLYTAELDYNSADPFNTLKNPNAFGTLYRFTDNLGNQDYIDQRYIIDHLTGLGWYNYSIALGYDWATYIDWAEALNTEGYDDWRIANYHEATSIYNYETGMNVAPFNIIAVNNSIYNNGLMWTSTNINTNNAYNYQYVTGIFMTSLAKTTTNRRAIVCRNHYN